MIPYTAQLASASTDTISLFQQTTGGLFCAVRSMYVDNTGNSADVSITAGTSNQKTTVPAGSFAWLPVLEPSPPALTFVSTGGVNVPVFLYEEPMPALIQNGTNFGSFILTEASPGFVLLETGGRIQLES